MKYPRNGMEIWTSRSEVLRSSMFDSGAGYPEQIAEVINILETESVLSRLTVFPNFRVLDVGAGGGRWSRVFAEKVKSVVALEPSDIYETLSERMAGFSNVICLKKSLQDFYSDESFDVIIISGVLMYLTQNDEVLRFLEKVSKLLRNGGFLVLREPIARVERCVVDWGRSVKDVGNEVGKCQYWEVLRPERFYVYACKRFNLKKMTSFGSHAPFFISYNPGNRVFKLALNFSRRFIHKGNLGYIKLYDRLFREPYGLVCHMLNIKCFKIIIFGKVCV